MDSEGNDLSSFCASFFNYDGDTRTIEIINQPANEELADRQGIVTFTVSGFNSIENYVRTSDIQLKLKVECSEEFITSSFTSPANYFTNSDDSTSQNIECKVGEANTFQINAYTFDFCFSCPIVFSMHYESSSTPL